MPKKWWTETSNFNFVWIVPVNLWEQSRSKFCANRPSRIVPGGIGFCANRPGAVFIQGRKKNAYFIIIIFLLLLFLFQNRNWLVIL